MSQNNEGFTLIELLLTLSILSIVITLGFSVGKSNEKNNLLITAGNIRSLIRQGQEIAYKQENKQQLHFSKSGNICYRIENSMIVEKLTIPKDIQFQATSFDRNNLYFNKKLAPSKGGTIQLESKGYKLKITVIPVTGRVKVYPAIKGM